MTDRTCLPRCAYFKNVLPDEDGYYDWVDSRTGLLVLPESYQFYSPSPNGFDRAPNKTLHVAGKTVTVGFYHDGTMAYVTYH